MSRQIKRKVSIGSQNAFRSIEVNAKHTGVIVNSNKTNLLCISDSLNFLPETYIVDNERNVIKSTDSMKLLGFHFTNRPTASAHVDAVCKKIRR